VAKFTKDNPNLPHDIAWGKLSVTDFQVASSWLEGFNSMREKARRLEEEIENAVSYMDRHPNNAYLPASSLKKALADFRREAGEE